MNTEVIPMVETGEDVTPESSSDCAFVELGQVSTDTEGWGFLGWDGGIGLRW